MRYFVIITRKMENTSGLYTKLQGALAQRFDELNRLQQLNPLVDQVIDRVVGAGTHVPTPGIGHIKTALRRVCGDIPTGEAFASPFYDINDAVISGLNTLEDLEASTIQQSVRSQIFVIANNTIEGGKVGKKIEEWLDGEQEAKSMVVIHTMTPEGDISFDIHSITFVAVKVKGGGTHCYAIVPNDNKGKIIATEAMQNEFGDIRESFGYIDTCPVKAVDLSPIDKGFVEDELKRALEVLPKRSRPEIENKFDRIRKGLGGIGTRVSQLMTNRPKVFAPTSVDNSPDKR